MSKLKPAHGWMSACVLSLWIAANTAAAATPAMSTETFLDHLGVNTHLNGLTASDPWNSNAAQVAKQLAYIGVRLDRDWAWSAADGARWKRVQAGWKIGRFWTSIDEAGPSGQRADLLAEERIEQSNPGLIYAMGGPNEEDDAYPQSRGATLPDSALVQSSLYAWAHPKGIPVSQMEFGAGWTAANAWEGDYNPSNTGIHENYTPGPADFGGAHSYVSNPDQIPVDVLNAVRADAELATPGKPVAQTEVGAYYATKLSLTQYGQYMVIGAFDSASAGDAAYIVYGLQSSAPEQCYGFFAYPSGVAFPVAHYYHTMTTLLGSRSAAVGPGASESFKPTGLPVTFSNSHTGHMLLEKPSHVFVIADYSEQLASKPMHGERDTVGFGRRFATAAIYDVEDGVKPIAVLHGVNHCALTLTPDDVDLIVLR